LPVVFGVAGACCFGLVVAACAFAALFREAVHGFASYAEHTKTFILMPLLVASLPVGFLASNLLVWSIPLARRYFARESRGKPGEDFPSSMRGCLRFSKYLMPPLLAIGLGAALFGK
jgi:hypothetical protein